MMRRYLSANVSEGEQLEVDTHLAECPGCLHHIQMLRYLRENYDSLWDSWKASEHGHVYRQWRLVKALREVAETRPSLANRLGLWLGELREGLEITTRVLVDRPRKVASLAVAALPFGYDLRFPLACAGVGSPNRQTEMEEHLRKGSVFLSEGRIDEATDELLKLREIDARYPQTAVSEVCCGGRVVMQIIADGRRGRISVKSWSCEDRRSPAVAILLPMRNEERVLVGEFETVEGEEYVLAEFEAHGAYALRFGPIGEGNSPTPVEGAAGPLLDLLYRTKKRESNESRLPLSDGQITQVGSGHPQTSWGKSSAILRNGTVIGGKYEVRRILGVGGFGTVCLAYDREMNQAVALKTLRDDYLADAAARKAFEREALLWVNLEEHAFILAAQWVHEAYGRLFVQMDYIPPDDHGRVNLRDHLLYARGPIETDRALEWAIEFCYGMEHANARGIRAHGDIKPANTLITQDGMVKVTDFGLATGAAKGWEGNSLIADGEKGGFGLSLVRREGRNICGTPCYIAPEVYRGDALDVQSDIYSFGLVLWQMAAGSLTPPFSPPYRGNVVELLDTVYRLQTRNPVPHVESPYWAVIERSLRIEPEQRYKSFAELRGELQAILQNRTGRVVEVPIGHEQTAGFWTNKGGSLHVLGRHEEAIVCYDKALTINPRHARAWNNKGGALDSLGRPNDAISCCDAALKIDARFDAAWANMGNTLCKLGRYLEAITCYDNAMAIDPRFVKAWNGKSRALHELGRDEEALSCCDKALEIDTLDPMTWNNKAMLLYDLGRHDEAIACCDKALSIDPRHTRAWSNKSFVLAGTGRFTEALVCFDMALAVDPGDPVTWNNKGSALHELGRYEEAIACYDKALDINPQYAVAWDNKGRAFFHLDRCEEAIICFSKAIGIDAREARTWYNKALSEDRLGQLRNAAKSYRMFIDLASRYHAQEEIANAQQRLRELERGLK